MNLLTIEIKLGLRAGPPAAGLGREFFWKVVGRGLGREAVVRSLFVMLSSRSIYTVI